MSTVKMPKEVEKGFGEWYEKLTKFNMVQINDDMKAVVNVTYASMIGNYIKDVEQVLNPIIDDYDRKMIEAISLIRNATASFKLELSRLEREANEKENEHDLRRN